MTAAANKHPNRATADDWPPESSRGWPVIRLRFCATVNPSRSELNGLPEDTEVSFVPMESVCEYGGLRLDQTKPLADVSTGYTYFRDGDVVVAKITPCFENGKGSIAQGLTGGVGFGTTELHVLRPTPRLDPAFLFYLTISHPFRSIGAAYMYGAGGQKRVPDEFVRDFRHPIPTIDKQRAIAAILDRETARIDALIEKKRRQIELLHEKRAALISHAVTKGLDPTAPMKDSGIDWLGKIPTHWVPIRFKRCIKFITSGPRGWAEYFSDDGELFIRIGNLNRDSIDLDLSDVQHVAPPIGAEAIRTRVHAGDILVSITADLGSVAVVPPRVETAYISQHIALARPMGKVSHPRWLGYSIFSDCCRNQLRALGYGGTKIQLGLEDVQNLVLCLPPHEEQKRIVSWLNIETGKQSQAIQKVYESISTLREYRTALISAAVTGKIDVREPAA